MGGGGGNSGPTLQQQQLETQQALTNANLNLEENSQRKSILNSMMGTRVFRGSALARALRGNTPGVGGENATAAPSRAQVTNDESVPVFAPGQKSLLDQRESAASGTGGAGGVGASADVSAGSVGGYRGGGSARGGVAR